MAISSVTKPRSQLVSISDTPYYHCVGRCVRRAFLCGTNGSKSYEHRRQWLVDRIKHLSSIFTIDIAAYAIMSNHYHLVLHVDRERAINLTDAEVVDRWLNLHQGPEIIRQHRSEPTNDPAKLDIINQIVTEWRTRLCDLSWFMKELNEYIAKHANREDGCTGHFWESRFKSQALLDETALFSCMAYVDLNPIRANMAKTPETSDYTSIQERLGIGTTQTEPSTAPPSKQESDYRNTIKNKELMAFSGNIKADTPEHQLPYNISDYIELVDWTGRAIRSDKKGFIASDTPPILRRLNIATDQWLNICKRLEKDHHQAIGPAKKLEQIATNLQQKWLKGITACRQLYS